MLITNEFFALLQLLRRPDQGDFFEKTDVFTHNNKAEARQKSFLKQFNEAAGVWFEGGQQPGVLAPTKIKGFSA